MCFYGVGEKGKLSLRTMLLKRYSEEVVNTLIEECRKKKTVYDEKIVYFGGHQSRLGHYFRHLFQTVSFVDRAKFLNDEQKYEYVKILRVQLTTYEQALFFFNSLSLIGEKWEKNEWVAKYKMIKNLPPNWIEQINPKDYYNKFLYEWEE